MERTNTNQNFFKRQITAKEILSGFVSVPDQAVPLTDALSSFSSPSSTSLPRSLLPPPPPPPLPSTSTYPTPLSGQPSDSSTPSLPPFTARANFDFRGEREGDLTFQKGDLIQVLEYPASMVSMVTSSSQVVVVKEEEEGVHQHTWWVGECHGRRGMFPANYCTVVSPSS
ncbi:hypothetical protein HMI55_001330 [Coelomomyces lativittatus]|nr:hypothetical protein HMI56_003654 [Coelomomyces lativittatus]KAJ1506076.1 hypothetical protein HMI55_001330 [Coelomomyces lativittatus]